MNVEILMQGPIYENTQFIYRNYKQNGFNVTVSAYNDTDKHLLKLFNENDIVLSNTPTNMGIYNRNGQRLTTNEGIKHIKSKIEECFVLKTRSDHFFKDISNAIKTFVDQMYKHKSYVDNQKYRMVIPNAGTTTTKIWGENHISDHWMFGYIDNVLNYYTMDNVDITKDFQVSPDNSPESEFCLIWKKNNQIFDSFEEILGKRFVILDNEYLNYVITKNCYPMNCTTDWVQWNSKDGGVVYNKKWLELKQKVTL